MSSLVVIKISYIFKSYKHKTPQTHTLRAPEGACVSESRCSLNFIGFIINLSPPQHFYPVVFALSSSVFCVIFAIILFMSLLESKKFIITPPMF